MQSIQFILSDKKEREVKSELLSDATKDAKSKADLLADSLNTRIKGIISIQESSPYSYPVYYASAESLVTSDKYEIPSIQPENVKLTVSVNVVFEI